MANLEEHIECKEVKDWKYYISLMYHKEKMYWHRNVHENGGTTEENIEDTLAHTSKDSRMYVMFDKGRPAAYFVINSYLIDVLEGFHIDKNYRNKKFIKLFWSKVKSKAKGDLYTGIYDINVEAINHLKRQGFEAVDYGFDRGMPFTQFKISK